MYCMSGMSLNVYASVVVVVVVVFAPVVAAVVVDIVAVVCVRAYVCVRVCLCVSSRLPPLWVYCRWWWRRNMAGGADCGVAPTVRP